MEVRRKKWFWLFVAVLVIVLAQVGWWTTIFLNDVNVITALKFENIQLKGPLTEVEQENALEMLRRSAIRRRVMFLSESLTFIALSCFGLYLLYRAMQMEAHSREIEKNFIEVVSHESKTPITAMKLRLESVLDKRSSDTDLVRELKLSLEEVRRLASIFDKAMGVHRLERKQLTFVQVDLSDVVSLLAKRMEPLMVSRGVDFKMQVEGETRVLGDSFGLENAIQCLMENAVLHNTGESKRLKVSISTHGGKAVVRVEDNGPGIRPEDRGRIFDRFYRGKRKGTPVSGTGLGLYIAYRISKAHQGDLKLVESGDNGSVFELEIPRVT